MSTGRLPAAARQLRAGYSALLSRTVKSGSTRKVVRSNLCTDRTIAPNLHGHQVSYCVLFPEFPTDDSRSVDFLSLLKNAPLPPFRDLEDFEVKETLFAGLRAVFEFSIFYDEHERKFKEPGFPKTFESVVEPIVRELNKARYGMEMVLQILSSTQLDALTLRELERIQHLFHNAECETRYSLDLYKIVKELHADPRSHNKWQRGVLRVLYNDACLNGLDLTQLEMETLLTWSKDFVHAKSKFVSNIANFYPHFEKTVGTAMEWDDPPFNFLFAHSTSEDPLKGPWGVKINPATYITLLKYCRNRTRRYSIWRYWNMTAGFSDMHLNNSLQIEEIRLAKHDMAKLLGCNSHLETLLRMKMANTENTIKEFLLTLKSRMKTRFARKYQELCAFAKLNDELPDPVLKPWDMYYYSRKEALNTHRINAPALRDYFPAAPFVWNLLSFSSRLFGFEIEDITEKCQVWDDRVQVLEIKDEKSGDILGNLYLDIYGRVGKNECPSTFAPRKRCLVEGQAPETPVVFLSFPFHDEDDNKPACLSWEEMEEVARKIGEALSLLLTESPYPEVGGQHGMQQDTVTFFPNFMEQLLHQPKVLSGLSSHYRTADRLKEQDAQDASQCFMESNFYEVYRRIFLSEFDFWNSVGMVPFWKDLYTNLWADYFPFALEVEDDFPCSFTPIYTERQMGNYYSELWSKMMAIDVIDKFKEESEDFGDREAIAELGRKLRKDIISAGGAVGFRELYVKFQGRDPSVEPFLRFYGAVEDLQLGDRLKTLGQKTRPRLGETDKQKIEQSSKRAIENN